MSDPKPDLDTILNAAQEAFTVFSKRLREDRADLLNAFAQALEADRSALVALADEETSLGPVRLNGELSRTAYQLDMCAALVREGSYLDATIDTALYVPPPHGQPDLRRINLPLGPVAVFAASNFPFAFSVLGNDTASALAVGCPVVLAAHPGHPRLTERVADIARNILAARGFDPAVLAILPGDDHTTNRRLVEAQEIRAAGFTGSVRGGRALLDAISSRPEPIPFFGELGAVNPVFLLPKKVKADGTHLAEELAAGATLGMGQFCTNPGLIFVPEGGDGDAFVKAFTAHVSTAPQHALLNDRIAAGFRLGLDALTGSGLAEMLLDGGATAHSVFATSAEAVTAHAVLREEVFGPATLIARYGSAGDLPRVASALDGSLTASIHGADGDAASVRALLDVLETKVGRILFAGVPPGVALARAMVHGGPWPASSRPDTSSVGSLSLARWLRPVCFQSAPVAFLPEELRDENEDGIPRMVNGVRTADAVSNKLARPLAPQRETHAPVTGVTGETQ